MSNDQVNITSPFKHIALSLSGGGVRAVGFHLGTLDYLDRIGLLKEVHTLSSVSGGSLIAIGYALSLKKGETFQEYYDNLCTFLPEVNTFEELLKILGDSAPVVASGSKTLITAFAAVYREKYFKEYYGDPTFGIFGDKEPQIHLKELIVNATEFKSGLGFRFQTGLHGSLVGNSKVSIKEEFAKDIRMSDIMAASSCIPVGMEPLMFPQDFHWPDDPAGASRGQLAGERPRCDEVEAHLKEKYDITNIALMDGGIYDNQGISSIIQNQARIHRREKLPQSENPVDDSIDGETDLEPQGARRWAHWFLNTMDNASDENQKDLGEVDLFVVSDTPVLSDTMYSIPSRDKDTGKNARIRNLKLSLVNTLGWVVMIILVMSVLVTASFFSEPEKMIVTFLENFRLPAFLPVPLERAIQVAYYVALAVQVLAVLAAALLMYLFRKYISQLVKKAVEVMPPMSRPIWSYAKNLTLGELFDMFTLRASSMSALTAKIFMHRVRQLGYSLLYSHDHLGKRVLDNNINDTSRVKSKSSVPEFARNPSYAAQRVTKIAASMGTKLWVNKPENEAERDDLENLIAAGHISTCFNIIEHLWENHRNEDGALADEMIPLFEQVKADWLHLNEEPYWLLDIRENAGKKRGELFWRKLANK